jgi:hypothetical protein
VQSTTAIIDSMSFVINDIVRNSRIAQRFWCGTELNDGTQNACGGDSFTFQAVLSDGTVGSEVTYRLNSGTSAVEKSVDNGIYAQLTSDRLTIDHMNFEIFDAAAGDARPTRTLITLVGTYEKGTKDEVTYRFQTTVTQRVVE